VIKLHMLSLSRLGRLNRPPFHLALIAILGLAAYSNTFNVPFQWDEKHFIVNNPIVKDLGYFLHPSKAKGHELYGSFKNRYIGYLTFALNYRLHGLDVRGYHIFNLAVHILNALLVYFLVVLTMRTPFLSPLHIPPLAKGGTGGVTIALFSALLFVSHPVQTEAVTYIFQRLASLCAFFYLLSLVLYIKWRLSSLGHSGLSSPCHSGLSSPCHSGLSGISLRKDSRQAGMTARQSIFYLASLLSAVLAMKTKENAFTLPVMIALYEFFFFRGHGPLRISLKRRLLPLIPFILTMLIIPLALIGVDKPIGEIIGGVGPAMGGYGGISKWDYLFTQFRVIVTYIRLLFLPVNQNIDYVYPMFASFLNLQVFLSFLFLLSLSGLGVNLLCRSRRNAGLRLIAFGIFWFFITLSVESSIIPLLMVINEYRVYLPSAGIFMAATTVVFLLLKLPGGKTVRMALAVPLIAIPFIFSYATYARNTAWESEISLWKDAVRKSPENAIAHNNLSVAYLSAGLIDEAMEHYEITLRLTPDNGDIYYSMANIYCVAGFVDKAIKYYETAIRLKPDLAAAHYNLGNAYYSKGLTEQAIEHYEVAIKLKPNSIEAHNDLGIAYMSENLTYKAITHFQRAIDLNPSLAEPHFNLGNAYYSKGLTDQAIEHYQIAVRLRADYPEAHYNLGSAYYSKGLTEQAIEHYQIAVKLNPRLKNH